MTVRALPITAFSAVSALGTTVEEHRAALRSGRSGLGRCPLEVPFEACVGAIPGALPPLPPALDGYDTRVARIAMLAWQELEDAAVAVVRRWGPRRVAVILGTSTGGIPETDRAFAAFVRDG